MAVVPLAPSGTKRTLSVARNSSALLAATLPTAFQVLPSRLYCQVPLPLVSPVMAIPCSAPLSTSLMLAPTTLATVCPALLIAPSLNGVSDGAAGVSTGASLSVVTLSVAWAMPLENARLPPLLLVSAVLRVLLVDAVPLLRSQARNDRLTFSPLPWSGT
ncbi:hypothetical protein D3C80_681530 [compost metagenome]